MVTVYSNLPLGQWAHPNARVVSLVVHIADEGHQPFLKFALGHDGLLFGVIIFAFPDVRERGSRERMKLFDYRANNPLDVSAVSWSFDRSETQVDAIHLARPTKSVGAEISAIIDMDGLGNAPYRPIPLDLMQGHPVLFGKDGMRQAHGHGRF